jgi:cell division protein FtsB
MQFQRRFQKNLIALFGVTLCVYFSYHLVSGNRGYMRQMSLKKTIVQQEETLSKLQFSSQALESKLKMMRPGSVDPDLLTERIRHVLGYKFADEAVIVRFPG